MHTHTSPPHSIRGDVAILYTFFIVSILLLGSLAAAFLVNTAIRSTRDINDTVQAFYAADTGIERGYYDYLWNTDPDASGETCRKEEFSLTNAPSVKYQITASGDQWSTGTCPTLTQVNSQDRAFCIEASGKTRGDLIKRNLRNDTNIVKCLGL